MRLTYIGFIVIGWVSVLWVAACGPNSPEDAVKSQYQRGEDAIAARDFNTIRNTMTNESWEDNCEELRIAREGTEAEVKALPAVRCGRVIALCNRLSAERLKLMSPDDYIIWQIDNGLMGVDADSGMYPHKVSIRGDQAEMQMGIEAETSASSPRFRRRGSTVRAIGSLVSGATRKKKTEPIPGLVYHFKNLNGYWYIDQAASMDYFNRSYAESAKLEGTSVFDYLLRIEVEEHGSLIEKFLTPPK